MKNLIKTSLLALSVALFPACGSGTTTAVRPADAAGLEALMTELQGAIRAGDDATASALTTNLFPSTDSIRGALRDGAAGSADGIAAMLAGFQDGANMATLFATEPARTQVLVHGATTEEIRTARSPAAQEFPGGAVELAGSTLREGMTFYEVECVEPGEDTGMKYHLFFHDGEGWRMLGPAWRAL